ncbi:MAG: sensor histidine kinase [Bacteroidales bacterium]
MRRFIEPIIHIAIWLGLYIFAILFIRTIGPFNKIDGTILLPITIGTLINAVVFYSIILYLIPRFANKNQLKGFLIGFLIIFLGLTLLETLIDYFFLIWIYSDSSEPFYGMLLTNGLIHLIFASLAMGYGFTRNWVVSEKKKQELIHEKLTAELNFLKTQLNPHFLFNVLNMAYSSASRKGDDQTADIIEKLSVLMRYMIYESNVDKIEVEKEIEFIRNYINLQKMRFSSDLPVTVTFTVNGHYTGYRIAPLILIPFIENAFKYGVKLEQNSEIQLAMNFQNGEMEFTARNSIFRNRQPVGSKNSGIGIKNTQKRLNILYPAKHILSITDNGMEFMVKLLLNLE